MSTTSSSIEPPIGARVIQLCIWLACDSPLETARERRIPSRRQARLGIDTARAERSSGGEYSTALVLSTADDKNENDSELFLCDDAGDRHRTRV